MLSLFAFLFLVIAMFAVFGMQLFGGHYNTFYDGHTRSNFDTFPQAWLTKFQVTSSNQWMSITYESMRLQWVRQWSLILLPFVPESDVSLISVHAMPYRWNYFRRLWEGSLKHNSTRPSKRATSLFLHPHSSAILKVSPLLDVSRLVFEL
jgi:hypothetical protein